jgi:tRNA A-37 threonylcarbamoyl transferase component Bud32
VTPSDPLFVVVAVQLGYLDANLALQTATEHARGAVSGPVGEAFVARGLMTSAQRRMVDEVMARLATLEPPAQALARMPVPLVRAATESLAATSPSFGERVPNDVRDEALLPEQPGRYRAVERDGHEVELGRGGIGRVVAVHDTLVGREVALKHLRADRVGGSVDSNASLQTEARFLREARLTAQLEHPSIVPVFEIGRRGDGGLYYTMREVRGLTLARKVADAPTLEGRLGLVPSVLAVAHALASAHARGIIHRDVKPQNVMLGEYGETYLLDWGLARYVGRSDAEQERLAPDITGDSLNAVGTPSYMSPEQARGRPAGIDARADVWGVGAVLFEVLGRRAPYVGPTAIEVMQAVLTEPVPSLRALAPDAPVELVAVCERAMQRKPEDRYQSAGALAADLEAWLQGRRVSAHEYSSMELVHRFARRNRAALAVASVALVALLVGAGLSVNRIRGEQDALRHFTSETLDRVTQQFETIPGQSEFVERTLTETLAFYDREPAASSLTTADRATMSLALQRLAGIHRARALIAEARADLERCRELSSLDPLPRDEQLAVARVACEVARGQLERLQSDSTACARRLGPLWSRLEGQLEAFPQSGRWYFAVSNVGSEYALCRHEGEANTHAEDGALTQRTLELERHGLALAPGNENLRRVHVLSLRDAVLPLWDFAHPEAGLALGQEAIDTARPLASSHDYRGIVALGGTLRQQGMLLSWTSRRAEASALLAEARRVLERGRELEPGSMELLGELGDTLIEQGDGAAATEVLDRAIALGAPPAYADSRLTAVLLAGDTARVLSLYDASTRSLQGDLSATLAALLRGDRARAHELAHVMVSTYGEGDSQLQWPRGKLADLLHRTPTPLSKEGLAFIEEFEVAFPHQDDGELKTALVHLEASLRPAVTRPR